MKVIACNDSRSLSRTPFSFFSERKKTRGNLISEFKVARRTDKKQTIFFERGRAGAEVFVFDDDD
jgi:hypothetical protein